MSRLHAAFGFAALLLPVAAWGQQSDPGLSRFIYPNAKALIGIDWARIRQSPGGAMMRQQWLAAGPMADIPGLELLNDIDRIVISSPGKGSRDDAAGPAILIAIHGHFNPAQVREIFTRFSAKPQSYSSFQVYRPQGKNAQDTAFVLFDPETILFGDSKSIFAALDRNAFGAPSQPASSLLAHAAEMDANYEFWVIMESAEIMSNDQVAALFRGGEWISEAQGFEAGINLRAGLAADVTVRFSSDATAKHVTAELTRVINLASKDKKAGAPLQDIANKVKFSLDGSSAKISLRLTQQELEKSAQAFAESHKASARLAVNASPVSNSASVSKIVDKPAVIRIEGLDEGTREIPFEGAQH